MSTQRDQTNRRPIVGSMMKLAPRDGVFDLSAPGLSAIRISAAKSEWSHVMYEPSLCMVVQGGKQVILGGERFEYDEGRFIICSVEVPLEARVTRATESNPYLAIRLRLTPEILGPLIVKIFPEGPGEIENSKSLLVESMAPPLIDTMQRLIGACESETERKHIAPMIQEELLTRLLIGPSGSWIAQIGTAQSVAIGINRAIRWLKENFTADFKIQHLAEIAHMSASSFHEHFKDATTLSPLQYQKVLKLQRARQLLIMSEMSVGRAGTEAGYTSLSQFSREYKLYFGEAPGKDIKQLRQNFKAPSQVIAV